MKIKYKFMIVFASVFSLALVAVTVMGIQFFRRDKIAYVFSTLLENTQTASLMLRSELDSQKPLFELLASSFNFASKKFPDEAKSFLQMNRSLAYVQVDESPGKQARRLDVLGALPSELTNALRAGTTTEGFQAIFFPRRPDLWALRRVFRVPGFAPELFQMTLVYKRNPVGALLAESRSFDLFLASRQGRMEAVPKQLADSETYQVLKEQGAKLVGESPVTREIEWAPEGKEAKTYLITWVPAAGTELGFISFVSKEKALIAAEKMKRSSLGFLLLLLSLGLGAMLLVIRSLTNNIEALTKSLEKFSQGELKVRSEIESQDEVGLMSRVFNQMTDRIATLMAASMQQARMESELETARSVQKRFVPPSDLKNEKYAISGHFEPASECGGDWWYYVADDETCHLFIADVTGHGVASALLTAALRAGISAMRNMSLSMEDYVAQLNKVIFESGGGNLMCTLFAARVNIKTGELVYVNASHTAPLLLRREEGPESSVRFLDELGGPRLGQAADSVFRSSQVFLKKNDFMFAYTDGLSEFANEEGRMFGEKRIYKLLEKAFPTARKTADLKNGMLKSFKDFQKQRPLDDDLTFFCFQYLTEAAETLPMKLVEAI